ncbi:UNVERIFIED_CONTAM: hypothetical protein Slati_0450400 [Sesamum latifolium]|uniref:Uncharacterized protein n=1 Tax=Sesamum latifolium TaxID=2727402 RepID=A0AAW2XVT0_9LAMI
MCHPYDAKAWRHFDRIHPYFAAEPRNVTLSLCTDGFTPHGQYGRTILVGPLYLHHTISHRGMCMSSEYMLLMMVIPGPSNSKCLIDIYLQPLIEEL